MQRLRNNGLLSFEVEVLFRQELNMDQIKYIAEMIKALGRYMVLDREMLDKRAGKIGLSYIAKAVDYRLVTEYQYKDNEGSTEYYFYSLAPGGIYLLESENCPIHKLTKLADQQSRERILTFNKWSLDHSYTISVQIPQSKYYDYFITEQTNSGKTIIGYYSNLVDPVKIIGNLANNLRESKNRSLIELAKVILQSPYDYYIFDEIKYPLIKIGNKATPNDYAKGAQNIDYAAKA